jgi:mono/diheme cytochrome c family protein
MLTRPILAGLALLAIALPSMRAAAHDAPPADPAAIARGQYLADAGDCVACHTQPGGVLFAGGRPMATPFGTLFTPNISPDPETGIGKWTADQFYTMMHTGRYPDGSLLYPAMPFGAYTKVTRTDSDAIFAYLRSVPPVKLANRPHDLRFPYNNRSLVLGWRTLYFTEGEFQPNPSKSAEWNRGAYLVQGLGHCSMCHTAINALGGSSPSEAFEGGLIPMQDWYAPSLTSNKEAGLGDWDLGDITDLLRTGVSKRGAVYGPMAEVVYDSLQYLSDPDIKAMATYLKALAPHQAVEKSTATTSVAENRLLLNLGSKIYDAQCAVCHGAQGRGKLPEYPPLAGNQSIQMNSAVNPIRMVLNGGFPPGTAGNPKPFGMPPFAQSLSDDEVAAVVTFIRVSWGNRGGAVSARQANELRSAPLN